MQSKRKNRFRKLNNSGTALITAIVVVAFISILATTILYVAGRNYYIKMTDLRTKQSFYEAETGLEEVKAALIVEVSNASTVAYQYVMEHHAGMDETALEAVFKEQFFNALIDSWNEDVRAGCGLNTTDPITGDNYLQYVKSCVDPIYYSADTNPDHVGNKISLVADGTIIGQIVWDSTVGDDGVTSVKNSYATLYGVNLQYTSTEGYTTIISTDYVIFPPKINWTFEEDPEGADPGAPAPDAAAKEINMSECVQYSNWVKK